MNREETQQAIVDVAKPESLECWVDFDGNTPVQVYATKPDEHLAHCRLVRMVEAPNGD